MATEAADLQHPWKDFKVEIRDEALCAPKKKKKKPAEEAFW